MWMLLRLYRTLPSPAFRICCSTHASPPCCDYGKRGLSWLILGDRLMCGSFSHRWQWDKSFAVSRCSPISIIPPVPLTHSFTYHQRHVIAVRMPAASYWKPVTLSYREPRVTSCLGRSPARDSFAHSSSGVKNVHRPAGMSPACSVSPS